jgi:hypothetical protein
MNVKVCVGSAACLTLALASTAMAQQQPPGQTKGSGVHRIEIYNGPYRTVHYFSDGASAEEQGKLRDRERTENEAALADQMQGLLRQYVADESILERRRRDVQLLFYGHSNVITELYPDYSQYFPGYGYGYYWPYNNYGSYGYYPYGSGYGNVTSMNGLFGVGDEGRLKTELTKSLAARLLPAPKP